MSPYEITAYIAILLCILIITIRLSRPRKKKTQKPKTPQELSISLFKELWNTQYVFTHGKKKIDKETWKRLKGIQQRAKKMRALNRPFRTSGDSK